MTPEIFAAVVSVLLAAHFVGDFVLQSREMAEKKGEDSIVLLIHVTVYSLTIFISACVFLPFFITSMNLLGLLSFVGLNFVAHLCVDYVTSRLNKEWMRAGNAHAFFTIIGFDQMLHALTLIWSAYALMA